MKIRLLRIALILTVVALPFAIFPGRFEPYDPNRVGVLALLLIVGLPALRIPRPTHHNRLLYIAIILWCFALVISTVFALSFSRALTGDLIRRMGLLTHLLLMVGILVGASLDARTIGRGFWFAGVVVSVIILLQTFDVLPNPFQDAISDRVSGLIGTPPAVGGWLALALVWGIAGFTPPQTPPRTQGGALTSIFYVLGLALIAVGLVLTQARGGLLATAAGMYTLLLLLALTRRWRWLIVALIAAAFVVGIGTVILSRIDWGDSFLTRLPLISRLNPALPDSPRIAREIIWGSTLEIVVNPAPLADVHGTPDPFYSLRRWFGHGLESFETVFRPLVTAELRRHEGGRPIDRAHNDWLDTGVTAGWFGMAARLMLWMGIVVVGKNALTPKSPRHEGEGILKTFSLPLLLKSAGLRETGGQGDEDIAQITTTSAYSNTTFSAIVMLAVVAAHFVDLTFNFTSVLTGWAFWLAVGVLLRHTSDRDVMFSLSVNGVHNKRILAEDGNFSRRGLIYQAPTDLILSSHEPLKVSSSESIYVRDKGRRSLRFIQAILFICAAILWQFDAGADVLLQQGVGANSFLTPSDGNYVILRSAASTRPWDDRLWNAAANSAIRFLMITPGYPEVVQFMQDALANALTLNRYDAPSAYLAAVVAAWQADHAASVDAVEKWLNEAEAYHAAAARLMPGEPYIWREWGRFMLTYRGDQTAARQYVERALALDPGDAAALELLEMLPTQ